MVVVGKERFASILAKTHLQWLVEAIRNPTAGKCILWPFRMVDGDHALVRVSHKKYLVHRLAYKLHYGEFPMPLGLRMCAKQRCVNPLHILAGDNADDGRLRSAQGRTNRKLKTAINLYDWIRQQIETRFDIEKCWPWPHHRTKQGYGRLGRAGDPCRNILAHRAAFEILHGHEPMPKGRHTCDHPWCFNPYHVAEGTQAQNVADMMERGHHVAKKGSEHGGAKLTDEQVREIRSLYDSGIFQPQIAKQFGLCQTSVSRIVRRDSWKHVE
jgi:hypothetical protein